MAFTNLPANLQDMFYGLSDRVAKLETGPNQAAYTADTAQSTASSAQGSATAAYNAALAAAAQATSAQYTAGVLIPLLIIKTLQTTPLILQALVQITLMAQHQYRAIYGL